MRLHSRVTDVSPPRQKETYLFPIHPSWWGKATELSFPLKGGGEALAGIGGKFLPWIGKCIGSSGKSINFLGQKDSFPKDLLAEIFKYSSA